MATSPSSAREGGLTLSYLSKTAGIGGALKTVPEDFLVEEIAPDGAVYELMRPFSRPDEEGKYVHFILQKKNWSTSSAISEIGLKLGIGHRYFNIAGTKDKAALTTQAASVLGASKESLLSLSIKDISINGAWTAPDRIRLGQLLGNRFNIKVRDCADDSEGRSEAIMAELGGQFPNYFGAQRFGSARRNTHLVGEKLLQGDLEGAVVSFLCDSEGEKNEAASAARKNLSGTRDFAAALCEFPRHLRLERSMLAYLSKNPGKYANALKKLPRNILLLFVHAFQSHLFNRLLSERISEGTLELEEGEFFCGETLGFPDTAKADSEGWICMKIIGYASPLNTRERALMDELGISKEAFKMKALPEIRSKGTYRTLLAPMKDFNYSGGRFHFSLPSGSYATMAMREFMK
ncbi:MAG TPA: tRNA pseudouridine(13) synthase TruD [Candidatus Bilamarchaeum sp.]|nr:tRNA pseudouridine(13) synthase TruD [Candidatus Bilamarchaeum sp.]